MVDDFFAEAVRAAVAERVDGEAVIIPVTKNNGLRLTSLTVHRTRARVRVRSGEDKAGVGEDKAGETGEAGAVGAVRTVDAVRSIEPNFYLDNIPEDMRTVENVDEIADRVIRAINRSLEEGGADGIVAKLQSLLADKEQLLNSLLPRVVNYEWNKEMLEGLPHRRYLDLAITYEIEIEGGATCRIRNGMGVDIAEQELYEAAMRNARLRKYQVTGRVHDEVGLRALDAILYGPVREIKELTDEVAEKMAAEFEKLHPDFQYDHLEIHSDYCNLKKPRSTRILVCFVIQ